MGGPSSIPYIAVKFGTARRKWIGSVEGWVAREQPARVRSSGTLKAYKMVYKVKTAA
jgi:hypothetical protein